MVYQAGEMVMDNILGHQADLSNDYIERISRTKNIAVDCEMGGLNPHRDLLYLVQVADENNNVVLVKTRYWDEAKNLKSVLVNKEITKIFHFALMDCAFLDRYMSISIENVFCTKIASKLARTYSNSHSLGSLLEELLGLEKEKKMQTSYWGGDITQEQMQYAANDVKYLMRIKDRLESILAEKGSLSSGLTYLELNSQCQQFIPTLTQLWLNGWDFGVEDPKSVFGH